MKNILMTVKDCETTTINSPVVEKTIELASKHSSKVQIIHVAPPPRPPYNIDSEVFRIEIENELRHEHDQLQDLAAKMHDLGIVAEVILVQGSIITKLLQQSEWLAIDLIILGRHKHGPLYSMLMDDTDEGLLARCSCPIMFVPT